VSPEFLDLTIARVRRAGFDLVDLDEAARRLETGKGGRFACFTLDDGYRDNRDHALPVFERHDCPLTVYVASGFAARTHAPWWIMAERVIAAGPSVYFAIDGTHYRFDCDDPEAKSVAYETIAALYNGAPGPAAAAAMDAFAARNDFDIAGLAGELAMGWEELADFARHPLVTLGAHTVSHPVLAALSDGPARAELADGAEAMERHLGLRPRHAAYPYGHDWAAGPREFAAAGALGFRTAVTTRKGVLFAEHAGHLTALPRVSLNGDYQQARYLDVLISGAAFALLNRFRRVNAA
jgi:peptidoglycan/xylan/chitin deacetylase (PgdA/CDA1 family)